MSLGGGMEEAERLTSAVEIEDKLRELESSLLTVIQRELS